MKKKILTNTYLREAEKYELKLFLNEEDNYISVKHLIKVSTPFILKNGVTAMDNGYYIVEILPKNKNYALRIFLDDKKEVVEYYFDIIKESGIDEAYKVPYFIDLYLDITIQRNGDISIIDEDEFIEAYKENDITEEDYNLVLTIKDKLLKEIKENTNDLLNINYKKYLEGI